MTIKQRANTIYEMRRGHIFQKQVMRMHKFNHSSQNIGSRMQIENNLLYMFKTFVIAFPHNLL